MVLEIVIEVVQEELLLLLLLDLRHDPDVQVHHQRSDLAGLPVLPQPTRDVEEDSLERKWRKIRSFYILIAVLSLSCPC